MRGGICEASKRDLKPSGITRSLREILRSLNRATHVVLPGVGAFGDCVNNLQQFGLIEPLRRTIAQGKPFLGICVGLQVLFSESEEFGVHRGLNIF